MMPAKELASDAPGCWQAKPTSTPTLPNHPEVVHLITKGDQVHLPMTKGHISAPSGLLRQIRKEVEEDVELRVELVAGLDELRVAVRPASEQGRRGGGP